MPSYTIYDSKTKQNLKLITVLHRCLQSINKKELPVIQSKNLTDSQFGVLEYLYHKGPNNIKTITEKTLSTAGNMTVVLANLEKLELVNRKTNPTDRRASIIELTPKGIKLISDLFPAHIHNLNNILSVLNHSEKELLIKLAKKLGKQKTKE